MWCMAPRFVLVVPVVVLVLEVTGESDDENENEDENEDEDARHSVTQASSPVGGECPAGILPAGWFRRGRRGRQRSLHARRAQDVARPQARTPVLRRRTCAAPPRLCCVAAPGKQTQFSVAIRPGSRRPLPWRFVNASPRSARV